MTTRNEEVLSNLSVMLEFQNIFLGGGDTDAITVIWATAEFARNPIIMKHKKKLGALLDIKEEQLRRVNISRW